MSSRMSLGGGGLRDGGFRHNRRARSASASRRKSMGGMVGLGHDAASLRSETPKKDRRALLEQWRQTRGTPSGESKEVIGSNKRTRMTASEAPPLPRPSSNSVASASSKFTSETPDGMSALERFRWRKQQKLQQNQSLHDEGTLHDEDDFSNDDYSRHTSSAFSIGTPSGLSKASRRRSMSAKPMRGRDSPLTAEIEVSQTSYVQPHLSQLTEPDIAPVEDGGNREVEAELRSRLHEMEQRVKTLEEEKMALSMSKAPLETRFRQKEDAWIKDKRSLLQEIDSLKLASREADERSRDLAVKIDMLDEENRRLKFEMRKVSSTRQTSQTSDDNSMWSRQLQNDRDVTELKEKLHASSEELDSMRLAKVSVEKALHATTIELESVMRKYEELEAEYDDVAAASSENKEAEIQLEALKMEHIATSAQLNAVSADLAATRARYEAALKTKDEEHKKEVADLQFEFSVLKARAASAGDIDKSEMNDEVEDEAVLRARIEERDRKIAELEGVILKIEQQRRQMHNIIQELRGNIRVFVRTRPFLPGDGKSTVSSIDVSPDGESLSISDQRSAAPHDFKFDKVFAPSSGQDQVFEEVSDFVQSALDGYHVCLFSYGQTGSGKTHTMQGSGNGAMRGIIPRAVEQILSQATFLQSQKWEFRITASFLEIYNENLNDLLVSMAKDGASRGRSTKLSIKRNREGKSYVEGLTEVPIETVDTGAGMQQLDALMSVAARARSVASTKMNAQSSRSHSVFMLQLHGYNEESGAVVHGALNLCDLAGSERLDRSGAGADAKRLRETQAINKSLSCLGDVFNALATGASHVPYRNSKLTYLLQDCLSGDGKALMFVNLSPTTASSNESLCSLRFAQRVNTVELGKATKHIQYSKKARK